MWRERAYVWHLGRPIRGMGAFLVRHGSGDDHYRGVLERAEASAMYWNVLDSTAHRRPERPVPSSKAPGVAPSKTASRPPLAANHSQSAPVTRGTKVEKDHHCEVMDSRTALSSRLFFSCRCPPINQPFPNVRQLLPVHSRP